MWCLKFTTEHHFCMVGCFKMMFGTRLLLFTEAGNTSLVIKQENRQLGNLFHSFCMYIYNMVCVYRWSLLIIPECMKLKFFCSQAVFVYFCNQILFFVDIFVYFFLFAEARLFFFFFSHETKHSLAHMQIIMQNWPFFIWWKTNTSPGEAHGHIFFIYFAWVSSLVTGFFFFFSSTHSIYYIVLCHLCLSCIKGTTETNFNCCNVIFYFSLKIKK